MKTTMYYYKTTIQYEGTNYAGFQWQKGLTTVQSEFNSALAKILSGKFTTMGASRTDTGVHALEQIIKISSEESIETTSFLEILNRNLPADIRCIEISTCTGLFRPAAHSITKEYRYFFTNKQKTSKEETQFVANIANPLNIDAMNVCIQAIIGTHDFYNFYSRGSNVKTTVRTITFCELTLINPKEYFPKNNLFRIQDSINECFQLRIEARGFLKQMIRHIVGALWRVGSGKMRVEEFLLLLDGPASEKQMWKVARPNGLFLYRINYGEN